MRVTATKTVIRISILLFAGFAIFLVSSFVSHTMLENLNIDSPLMSDEAQTETPDSGCDPIVFVMDANGNVYSGKNVTGSLANTLDLTTKIREVIEMSASRLAYAQGMDLSLEVPLRCANEPVDIKTESHADDSRIFALIRALREVGINPTWLIVKRKSREVIQ